MPNELNKRFKITTLVVQVMSIIYFGVLLIISFHITTLHRAASKAHENSVLSTGLARALLESSEDLTRTARAYVSTGDKYYKEAFDFIIGMRNGTRARPPNYSTAFWYVNSRQELREVFSRPGGVSLRELMLQANFTTREIQKLDQTKTTSDQLALIEQDAFEIVDKLLINEDFEIESEKYKKAISLLYDDNYLATKQDILKQVDQVIRSVESRTNGQIILIQTEIRLFIFALWSCVVVGIAGLSMFLIGVHKKFINPLFEEVRRDALTGCLNRRGIGQIADAELERILRTNSRVSVLLVDIDHSKSINDTYGHAVGDQALINTANILTSAARSLDSVARWGGEEFLILLPEITNENAIKAGERFRKLIEKDKYRISIRQTLKITVSIGVSTSTVETRSFDELVLLADNQLYRAKNSGRNRVCAA